MKNLFKRNILIILLLSYSSLFAQTDGINGDLTNIDKYFDGLHFGANISSQNIISGAFIKGVDVLTQESRFVNEFSIGFRKQILNDRILLGVEYKFGFTNGNLNLSDAEQQLEISYENSTQSGLGITIGVVVSKRKDILIFGFINYVSRRFDITIRDQESLYHQEDNMLWPKYGIGVEIPVHKKLNAIFSIGSMQVDLDDKLKNIEVENKLDITLGINYQF